MPDVTWLSGIMRPATGLQICRLLIVSTSSRSASGGRATIGSRRVSCGKIPAPLPPGSRKKPTTRPSKPVSSACGDLDARDAVAAGLQLEQVGPNHLLALAPVVADADRAAVVFEDPSRAWSASVRSTAGSGPLKRAWMRPPAPGPSRNFLATELAFG